MHPEDKEIWDKKEEAIGALHVAVSTDDIDESLIDVMVMLNRIPGVATLYSCEGHRDHGSPAAFLITVLSARKESALRKRLLSFLVSAPVFIQVEFEHSIDTPICPRMYTRVKFTGDPQHVGKACLPMFYYIYDVLAAIGSSRASALSKLE